MKPIQYNIKILEKKMAKWFDKISKVKEKVGTTLNDTVSTLTKNYKEKGIGGISEKTDEIFSKVSERTQDYLKNISETNKEIMTEVEEKVKENNPNNPINSRIAGILAATVNTTQTIGEDLVVVGKKAFKNIADEIKSNENVEQKNDIVVKLNDVPLETVFKTIFKAVSQENNLWLDLTTKQEYLVRDNEWWAKGTQYGGKGAVSLLAYHLSILANRDYYEYNKELEFEAIGVLKNCFSNKPEKVETSDLEEPTLKTNKQTSVLLQPKKKTTRKRKEDIVSKNEEDAVKSYDKKDKDVENKPAALKAKKAPVKRAAKKTTVKPDTILNNEKKAVEAHEKVKAKSSKKTVAKKTTVRKSSTIK